MINKIVLSLFLSLLLSLASSAQTREVDSLKQLLAKEKGTRQQFGLIRKIANNLTYQGYPDSVPAYIKELYRIAGEQKNDTLLYACYGATATLLDFKTDSKEEIEYRLKMLALAEKKFPAFVPGAIAGFASPYNDLHQFERAIDYGQKALALKGANGKTSPFGADIYYQLAYAYLHLNKPDSTLHYGKLAEEMLLKQRNNGLQTVLSTTMADAYAMLGNNKVAEGYYQNSIAADPLGKGFSNAIAAGHYSRFLLSQHKITEAKQYGIKGVQIALSAQAKASLLENVGTLRQIYEAAHQPDSAYYFARQELAYRDSLFNQDKLNAVQDLTFKEELRQQEEAVKKAEEDLHRSHNLQYAAIAFGVVSFVILFFLLSHSLIANPRLIRSLGVVALLIVFEFVNLLIHPYLVQTTNDSPLLMLLVMVCIAALLVPLHHTLEHWVTHKLVEKNNRIRLTAAKKTIERLERKASMVPAENGTNA